MAASKAIGAAAKPAWRLALQKFCYNVSYFPQLGLMRHDILEDTEDVKEALRRVPDEVADARNFRITRALHLSGTKTVLPKEEWMTLEKDELYLEPYLSQVIAERTEKEQWFKQ